MQKFMFIIREDLTKLKQASEAQRFDDILIMDEWVKSLAKKGNYVRGGDALVSEGSYVNKDQVLSDGPFIESKEGISGFIFVEAMDLTDAASIAQSCPHVQNGDMIIEVRPVMNLEDINELGDEQRRAGH
jgi:hypothetical protein